MKPRRNIPRRGVPLRQKPSKRMDVVDAVKSGTAHALTRYLDVTNKIADKLNKALPVKPAPRRSPRRRPSR